MIADETRSTPAIGAPDALLLDANAFHHAIVSLIENQLPIWRDRPQRPPFQDEPKLNQSLCLHLNRAARHGGFDAIEFTQEPIQSSSRRGDIGVMREGKITVEGRDYHDWVQLLPIECKRLPTPPDSRRSDCEYVHGLPGHRNGAIERFKHGLHGPTNQRAMIIAYVQEQSFTHWIDSINTRLTKLAIDGADDGFWSPAELLEAQGAIRIDLHKLHSHHRRAKNHRDFDVVEIAHLWLLMN